MKGSMLSRRYAGALLDIALRDKQSEPYGAQLSAAAEVLGDGLARKALTRPLYDTAFKKQLITQTAAELKLARTVANFLHLLLDKQRIEILTDIAASYREMLDQVLGISRVAVDSAVPLDEADLGRLKVLLEKKLGRRVEMTAQTDPGLLGGLRVHVGSKVYDATLANHLTRLRETLKHQV